MSALESIYEEYYGKLMFSAYSILRDEALAEDAASESILKLVEYAGSHKHPKIDNPGAYLYSIVKNIAVDMYNSGKNYYALDELNETAATVEPHDPDRMFLYHALETLDERETEIMTMFYFYGYKIKQIADSLGMPEGTVKWKISEIKRHLSEFFNKK